MLFFPWVRRSARTTPSYQPEVCVLEERVVPALYRGFGPAAPPANVPTHLLVIAPANVKEGTPTNVTVEALNARNQLVTGFRGSVQISLGSADSGATVPAGFTFTGADKGKHTFQVTFGTSGPQTVIASSGGLTAQTPLTVQSVVTHFAVYAVGQAMVEQPAYVQVVALDANNNIAADYRGTVQITDSDVFGPQLDNYAFQPSDNGSHYFAVSFATVGNQTLTATDAANHTVSGAATISVLQVWSYPIYGGWGFNYGYGWY